MWGYAIGDSNTESNTCKRGTLTWKRKECFTWGARRLAFRYSYRPLTTTKCRQLGKCLLSYFPGTEILFLIQLLWLCLLFLLHFTVNIFTSFIVITTRIDFFFSITGKVTGSTVLKWLKLFTPISVIWQIITTGKYGSSIKRPKMFHFRNTNCLFWHFFNESFWLFLSSNIFHWRVVCIF